MNFKLPGTSTATFLGVLLSYKEPQNYDLWCTLFQEDPVSLYCKMDELIPH